MNPLRQKLQLLRYRVGKLFFPALEPLFILRENLKSTVRRHFDQAIKHIENKNFAVAQLNLNMVLSLYPNHFLACVYRGRIFLHQKQYRLASEDFMQANRISPFRFTHYRLYREYLESIGGGKPLGKGRISEDWMGRLKGILPASDKNSKDYNNTEASESSSLFFEEFMDPEDEQLMVVQNLDLTQREREKFGDMGPITPHEAQNADWDNVLKKLTS